MTMTDNPAATAHIASMLMPTLERTIGLAQGMVAGIPADRFARCPDGHPTMNHPAFIMGHLAIYPDRVFQLSGRPDLALPKDGFEDLFSPKARNQDDPNASIYPAMDEIMGYFNERHEALTSYFPGITDAQMTSEMPDEGFRKSFPTLGSGLSFLIGPHNMLHLGQLSAWRRVEGLGPAMPHFGE